jgi:hypothetical protein
VSGLFRWRDDHLVAKLGAEEAAVLRQLFTEAGELLQRPVNRDDPGPARLFPDVYPDSPDDSAEFRRFTESELRSAKVEQANLVLARVPERGGEVRLTEEEADGWLRALTDVRILLGTRLEVTDDTDPAAELDEELRRDPSAPRAAELAVYHYLTYVQESLVQSLAGW